MKKLVALALVLALSITDLKAYVNLRNGTDKGVTATVIYNGGQKTKFYIAPGKSKNTQAPTAGCVENVVYRYDGDNFDRQGPAPACAGTTMYYHFEPGLYLLLAGS